MINKRSRAPKLDLCLTVYEDKTRCDRQEKTKGLCDSHYSMAASMVKKGETTWLKLEAEGKCKPSKRKHGARSFFLGPKK